MINRVNFGLFASEKVCMWIETMQEVNVAIKGDCQLWSRKGTPLQLYGDVALTGNGTLSLVGSDADIEFKASDKTLTVDGPAVTLDGSCANAQLRGTADKMCRLHVYAGSVNFSKTSSGTPDAYAVMQMKSVSCATGIGIKTPHGAYFNSTGYLYDVDGKVIKGQEVLITKVQDYGIKIMGIAVTEANYNVLTKRLYNHFWDTAKDGKINYNPSSNTLTLEKVCIRNNTDLPTIDNISANGLKIILKGQNYFDFLHENSKDNLLLRANVNTTLATSKDDNFGSINNYSGGYGGIYVSGGATLTLDGSNCVLAVRPSHIYGGNGTIDCRGLVELDCSGHEDGTVRNVRFKKKMPLCSSMNAPRFIWNRTDGTPGVYESRTSLAKGEVRFVQEDENFIQHYKYIYVGDEYIHEYNKSCFMSECIKEGYLTYSPYTKELTLHSATIETDASTAIEIPNGITMVLEGQDKIKCTSQNNPLAVFVTGTNLLTIEKDGTAGGSLTVTANVPDGGGILTNGELTINGDITVPNITVPLLNVNSCTVNVTHQLKDVNSGKPAVSANLIEAVVGSTEQAPAYFDKTNHEVIAKNGAVKIVKKSDVITYPGITFCGQEVNSVNCSYLVNQFVKSGTIKVEPYDDGTKCNIDLYDVTFSGNPNAPVFEFKPSMTHVTFFINNNNTFQVFDSKNFGYPFIESWANYCYICGNRGDDNLVVTGSSDSVAGEICLQDHATLHISKNASTSFSATFPRISGPHGTKLIVKDPYLTVTGNSHGTILGVAIELPSDGTAELYSTSSSPRNIGANGGVFSDGVLCTGEVKFVKKGESYIRVQGITLDKQTLTFTKKGQTAQLNATVSPSNATNKTVTWRSNNENVATVDANGKVTAVGKGTTQIFAISEGGYGRSAQCIVTVNIPDATGITLDRTEYTFKSESVGSIFVRATLTPDNADYDEIKWSLHIEGEDSIAYIVGSGTGREVQVRPGEDGTCTPAVPVTASGKLTIPSQVTDSNTGKSYWVTSVSRKAFTLCGKLTEIEFSEGIRSIGERVCDHRMWALEKITLPSSIKVLDQQAFAPLFPYEYETGRSGIREVYIKAFTPPTGPLLDPYDETCTEYASLEEMGVFDGIAEDAVLYVPTGAKENYNHYPWVKGWVVDEYLDEGGFEADGWFTRIEEMDFGEGEDPDGIENIDHSPLTIDHYEDAWYSLDGRKLDSKPTKPGLYIRGGKKVIIK